MVGHGPFKTKMNAEAFASNKRHKGFKATVSKRKKGWGVSVTR